MSEHVPYTADDFTAEEIARRNRIAVAVIGNGMEICRYCGQASLEPLDGLCPKRSTDLEKVRAFLDELGLSYDDNVDQVLVLYADQGQPQYENSNLQKCDKLDGHPGFFGRFEFQQDGKFIRLGFWE